ncbi:MAG TPA: hypothetical protein VET25_08635, partial [Aestuariivirgaceae bacterium]|nr:hypothetical protein [Aestuariivirgaceae bacterium]
MTAENYRQIALQENSFGLHYSRSPNPGRAKSGTCRSKNPKTASNPRRSASFAARMSPRKRVHVTRRGHMMRTPLLVAAGTLAMLVGSSAYL